MANTSSIFLDHGGVHCRGCYDPALCSGIAYHVDHCAGCVLEDDLCLELAYYAVVNGDDARSRRSQEAHG